jgi:hypothetical protein
VKDIAPPIEKKMEEPISQRRNVSGTGFIAHTALKVDSTIAGQELCLGADLYYESYIDQAVSGN